MAAVQGKWVPTPVPPDAVTLAKLADKFGVTAQQIAAANGVSWSTDAINQWVLQKGGKWLPGKEHTVFNPGDVILLPAKAGGGGASAASKKAGFSWGSLLLWGALGYGVYAIWKKSQED